MKGFGQKSVSTRNFPKLHTLVSPKVNLLWLIEKRVAGLLQPWCFSCHPKNREGEKINREGDFLIREGEKFFCLHEWERQIVSQRKS